MENHFRAKFDLLKKRKLILDILNEFIFKLEHRYALLIALI